MAVPGSVARSAASVQRTLGHQDGEVIDLGRHKLRFFETTHVHHWDSMMLLDETTKSVFPPTSSSSRGTSPRS